MTLNLSPCESNEWFRGGLQTQRALAPLQPVWALAALAKVGTHVAAPGVGAAGQAQQRPVCHTLHLSSPSLDCTAGGRPGHQVTAGSPMACLASPVKAAGDEHPLEGWGAESGVQFWETLLPCASGVGCAPVARRQPHRLHGQLCDLPQRRAGKGGDGVRVGPRWKLA